MFSEDCIKEILEMDFPKDNNRVLANQQLKAYEYLVTKFLKKVRMEASMPNHLFILWNFIAKEVNKNKGQEVITLGAWESLYNRAKSMAEKETEDNRKMDLAFNILKTL